MCAIRCESTGEELVEVFIRNTNESACPEWGGVRRVCFVILDLRYV